MSTIYEDLMAMGFQEDLCKQASGKFTDLGEALDWIESVQSSQAGVSENIYSEDKKETSHSGNGDDVVMTGAENGSLSPQEEEELKQHELKQKIFGAKTAGSDLPPPAEAMTQEQLREMIETRRKQKLENSRFMEIEQEKKRREDLKKMEEVRAANEDRAKRLAREKEMREKKLEAERKKALLKQIELEKEMRRRNNGRLTGVDIDLPSTSSTTTSEPTSSTTKSVESTEIDRSKCSIKIRQTNGKYLEVFVLPSDSTVNDIYDYIDSHRTDGKLRYMLIGGAPRKSYPRNMVGTLRSLGMAPGISLIMSP